METSGSTENKKSSVKTLRRELEGWREVLVAVHSLLAWDKPFYPGIIAGSSTFVFLLIWYYEPSLLTLFSLLGLLVTLADFLVPRVSGMILGSHSWSGQHERQYEEIVKSIASFSSCVSCCSSFFADAKKNRPIVYFGTISG